MTPAFGMVAVNVGEATVAVVVLEAVGVQGPLVGVAVAVFDELEVGTSRSTYPKIVRALLETIVRELIGTRSTIGL